MAGFKLCILLSLTAACYLIKDTAAERITTCEGNVHRLTCDVGVIVVDSTLYGRTDRETCSQGRPPRELANTQCSAAGAQDFVKRRCDGKTVCEVNSRLPLPDPCRGTFKYADTNYTCFPAIRAIACERSAVELFCGPGQVIFIYGADYGRRDRTTCIAERPNQQIQNNNCVNPTRAAERCNGKNRCTLEALNSVFGDPCVGTYKYLEVSYRCEFPLTGRAETP
ncbi:L-rhamnose-binding lectin SML-like [Synchiropus picturatus]